MIKMNKWMDGWIMDGWIMDGWIMDGWMDDSYQWRRLVQGR
jgi:hypothetical protein